jgi:hypothetical protein
MEFQPKIGDHVAWYRYDDHITEGQRYGTVIGIDIGNGLTRVAWDSGIISEVFTSYLEPEAEVRDFFRMERAKHG